MIELDERLSEFSYGYGVTRAVENVLKSVGIRAVPFLPSLVHEKVVGFDVGFKLRGTALLLQFKLGQNLDFFRRSDPSIPAPKFTKPLWRFRVNTAEPDGQYETLLKAERSGAEVYYVAPKFTDWTEFAEVYETDAMLERSLLVTPADIRKQLSSKGIPDGYHRVVYDESQVYVCSDPILLPKYSRDDLVNGMRRKLSEGRSLSEVVSGIYFGLDERLPARPAPRRSEHLRELTAVAPQFLLKGLSRPERLEKLNSRARSIEDARAAALGLELWSLGMQLILATDLHESH